MRIISHVLARPPGFLSYEIGAGHSLPIKDFVLLIKELSGNTKTALNFGALPYRKNEVMDHRTDISGVKALGWAPGVGLAEGLKKTIEFERKGLKL